MTDTIEIDGLTFGIALEPDVDAGCPWDNMDTLGTVTGWESRDKLPGERIINAERGNCKRFYDFAGAVAKARRDEGLTGPRAVEAVEQEFQYLKDWCDDRWQYVGVVVTLLDTEGNPTHEQDSIWGVDDDGDYAKTLAYDLALGLHTRVGSLDVLTTETRIRS